MMIRVATVASFMALACHGLAPQAIAADPLEPFLEKHCVRCHGPAKTKGDLRFDKLSRNFKSAADFIAAFKAATGAGGASVKPASKAKRGRPAGAKSRRKRTKITDEIRAQVGDLVKAGKTNEEVAKTVGISAPSVQNIKKALGLVKARES